MRRPVGAGRYPVRLHWRHPGLYLRDMHINVSTGVLALPGIAIMDGVLMVRGISGYAK